MSWDYDPRYDNSFDGEDTGRFETYMDEIRDQALGKLNKLEISALFDNLGDFISNYKDELKYRMY
jgi:hypothetical protein